MTKIEFEIQKSGIRKNWIAGKCGVSQTTVTDWAKGRVKIKGIHLLILADLLDAEPKDLIGDVVE